MKKTLMNLSLTGLVLAGTALQADAFTLSVGEYRLSVSQALTHLTDPTNPVVAGRAAGEQGDQWALARMGTIEKRDNNGIFVPIWNPGEIIPDPPVTTHRYITAVLGGLTLQTDAANPFAGAPNTGLGYNTRIHPTAPGGAHPADYDTNTNATQTFPHKTYFVDDSAANTAYLKIFGTNTDPYAADAAAGAYSGPGTDGSFGSFGLNTIAGTLLLDFKFNPSALAIGDGSGVPADTQSAGADGILGTADDTFALLRAFASSDIESGILAFMDVTGAGAWDSLFNSNSANFFGADGQIDFTARALIGSPYLPPVPPQSTDPETAFGWDFRDTGQGLLINPIPEPSTMVLLGIGLLGIGAYGRKRIKK